MKHIKVTLPDEGMNVYVPREGQTWGYRYGPSFMTYEDGTIDGWFASPGFEGEADWFTYKRSTDGGNTWSDEVVVLAPTVDSMDWFSVCDPAVIKFGQYYYIGYTSTIFSERGGICNNGFVARSLNPDGPFEKWTGSGWGEHRGDNHWMGKPAPIIYFDETYHNWGAGELSFVVVKDILYIYYTWTSRNRDGRVFSQTRVLTADATREDWPLTIVDKGIAFDRTGTGNDSSDVIYVEDYEKFLAITTDRRFTDNSCLAFFESEDGLRFTRCCEVRTNVGCKCHNSGISGGPEHRVKSTDDIYLGYAYGDKWGFWGTRFHKLNLELTDEPDLSDGSNPCIQREIEAWKMPSYLWPIHISTKPHFYECHLSDGAFKVDVYKLDTCYNSTLLGQTQGEEAVTFTNYDKEIVDFDGMMCVPKSVGYTFVNANYVGRSVEFLVYVRPEEEPIRLDSPKVKSFTPMLKEYIIHKDGYEVKQIRGLAIYEDNSWFEICNKSQRVMYDEYDYTLISIDDNGNVLPKGKTGSSTVKVSCDGCSFVTRVTVV